MNSALSLIAIPLIALQLFIVDGKDKPCKKADLDVVEIYPPDYTPAIEGTSITIEIKNLGKTESAPCKIRVFDLDISYDEIVKLTTDTIIHEMIAENNGRAEYYNKSEYTSEDVQNDIDKEQYDYDFDWEVIEDVPALKHNQKHTVIIEIDNYWIYDSNCEIRVIIDEEKEIEDCNRENNQMDFFGWG